MSEPLGNKSPDSEQDSVLESVFQLQQELEDRTVAPNASGAFTVATTMPTPPPYTPELAEGSRAMNSALRTIKNLFDTAAEATRTEILKLKTKHRAEHRKYREAVGAWNQMTTQRQTGNPTEAAMPSELCRLKGLKDSNDRLFQDQLAALKSMLENSVRQQEVLLSLMLPHIIVEEEAQLENE